MALITCPECGGTVSNTAETCPHCGFKLIAEINSVNQTVSYQNVSPYLRNGYDVMLIDYKGTEFFTKRELAEILDCSLIEAKDILRDAPVYLYNDITFVEATNIAAELKESGIRAAVYAPDGSVEYYTPLNYSHVLPILNHILRKPRRIAPPRPRKERYPQPRKGINKLFGRKAQTKPMQQHNAAPNQHQQPKPSQPHNAVSNQHASQPKPSNPDKPSQNHSQQKPQASQHSTSNFGKKPGNTNSGSTVKPGNSSHSMGASNNKRPQGSHR